MRILHISTRLILGGSQENTVLSCEGQAALGHEVHLAFGPIYGPEGSLLERVASFRTPDGRRITTHIVPHLVREINPYADGRCLWELKRLVRRLRPDIVHTHSSKAGILGRAAAWAQRSPAARRPGIVHTIHGPPFMPIDGGAASRARTRLSNWMYTRAERFAARRCHIIVAVADAMTLRFLERGIGQKERYITVYSGIDTSPFLHAAPGASRQEVRRSLGLDDGDFVIGTVARLARHKGHDDLLDALADELRARPHWRLLWVGDGWWRDRLTGRARALGVEGRIVMTGLVSPGRVPGLIRAMDVLAHPSYREGLPRTVPQSLLCGVLPVAYDVDGTGEVCREMQTGRLVAPGDLAGLRRAIVWSAENPGHARELAHRGREECRERFSARRMVAELERVYAAAIELASKS